MIVYDGITDVMQFREQTTLAYYIGCTVCLFRSKIPGCGHGTGKDILVIDVEAHLPELVTHITIGPLTVIGKEKKGIPLFAQTIDKFRGPRDRFAALVDDAIHVDKKALLCAEAHIFCFNGFAARDQARIRRQDMKWQDWQGEMKTNSKKNYV